MFDPDLSVKDIIRILDLQPHPEGGFYRETYKASSADDTNQSARPASTAIYYLLGAGDCSAWHRVRDADELWHFYGGAPLALTTSPNGHDAEAHRLGLNLTLGERPQILVPADHWQTAESLGAWTLVGCTVTPGFTFDSFEMAPPDWRPMPRSSSR